MIISDKSNFIPAPEGMHHAVCVDIVDMGEVDTPWGKKQRIRLVWELPESKTESGKPFTVSKFYNPSLNEKAILRKDLASWRGRPFTAPELKAFDLENILGRSCQILISHNEDDGKTYANIIAITKAQKDIKESGTYIRVKDRAEDNGNGSHKSVPKEDMATSDIPF